MTDSLAQYDNEGLDFQRNRLSVKYSRAEMLQRLVWMLVRILFHYSPRPCFSWRAWILRCMGAKIGLAVHIYPSAKIYFPWMLEIGDFSAIGENANIYNLGMVTIGSKTTISQGAHLCAGTHDYDDIEFTLMKLPISIGDSAWICADAFVGPNVTIGDGAVVGARSVIVKDVAPWVVVAGNPAKRIKDRERPGQKGRVNTICDL